MIKLYEHPEAGQLEYDPSQGVVIQMTITAVQSGSRNLTCQFQHAGSSAG